MRETMSRNTNPSASTDERQPEELGEEALDTVVGGINGNSCMPAAQRTQKVRTISVQNPAARKFSF